MFIGLQLRQEHGNVKTIYPLSYPLAKTAEGNLPD